MAGKFLNVEEAAEKLGVSADQLVEMRSEGKIHGYRDGASWKFKAEEVERSPLAGNSDINLDEPAAGDPAGISDALDFGGGSDLELGSDDDEELVLEGSGIGSDVTLGAGDTGINLAEPSESGLDLEEPLLELEGSHASSLELPEDDDMIALETDLADPDEATQLKQDEEFLLQPMDDQMQDESDSGSQVIALEDSEVLDENEATMLGGNDMLGAAPVMMAEDPLGGDPGMMMAPADALAPADPNMQQQPVPIMQQQAYEAPEAPYSIWNVLALLCSVLLLIVSGMLMVDVVRNIWSWQGNFEATSSIMEALVDACGMTK
jgi:excisionase family DNA binding protein